MSMLLFSPSVKRTCRTAVNRERAARKMQRPGDKKKVSHEHSQNALVSLPGFLVFRNASQSDVADQRAVSLPQVQPHIRRSVEIGV
jgi:hypothetical protein